MPPKKTEPAVGSVPRISSRGDARLVSKKTLHKHRQGDKKARTSALLKDSFREINPTCDLLGLDESLPDMRVACAVCARRFDPARISRHETICIMLEEKKREREQQKALKE